MLKYAATATPYESAKTDKSAPTDEPFQSGSRLRSLTQLRPNQCKWPVSEDRAQIGHFLFCCLPVDGTSSYCLHHHQAAIAVPSTNSYRRQRPARR